MNMSELSLIFCKVVKHNSKCMVCGSSENLQWHHWDRKEKVDTIHRIAKSNNLQAVIAELNKCIPVCDYDHKRIHKGHLDGWMRGEFDNGKPSSDRYAAMYSPYLSWFAKRKPHILLDFHREHIEPQHLSLLGLFNIEALGAARKPVLMSVSCKQPHGDMGSNLNAA